MYCPNCGNPMGSDNICYVCKSKNNDNKTSSTDSGSPWWGVLGFISPLVGLILFCVWNKEKPKNAKSSGIGAIIGFIVKPIIIILVWILVFAGIATIGSSIKNEANNTHDLKCNDVCDNGGTYYNDANKCVCSDGSTIDLGKISPY